MSMTPEELAELRRLHEACPGEWYTALPVANTSGLVGGLLLPCPNSPGVYLCVELEDVAAAHLAPAARNALPKLLDEIERLRRGDFTEAEFQNLCHNLAPSDACRFFAGCEEFQRKLFGSAHADLLRQENARLTESVARLSAEVERLKSRCTSVPPNGTFAPQPLQAVADEKTQTVRFIWSFAFTGDPLSGFELDEMVQRLKSVVYADESLMQELITVARTTFPDRNINYDGEWKPSGGPVS